MPILQLLQPEVRNFWQKLFGKKLPYNAFVDVNNLMVRSRILDVRLEQILDIIEPYQMLWRGRFTDKKKRIYRDWLESSLYERRFDRIEIQKLRQLKDLLLLNDYEIGEVHQQLSMDHFNEVVEAAQEDQRLEEQLRWFLGALEHRIKMPTRMRQSLEQTSLNGLLEELLADVHPPKAPLSEEEEEMLRLLEDILWLRQREDLPLRDRLKELKAIWLVTNGFWPALSVDIPMDRKSFCVFYANAAQSFVPSEAMGIFEDTNLLRRVDVGYDWSRALEEGPLIDFTPEAAHYGRIYFTTQAIIFACSGQQHEYGLSKLENYAVRKEGLYLKCRKKPAQFFRFNNHNRLLAVILSRLIVCYFQPEQTLSRQVRENFSSYRPG